MPEDYISKVYSGMKSAYSSTGFKLDEQQFRNKLKSDPKYATKVYGGMNSAYSSTGFKLTQDEFTTRLGGVKKKEPTVSGGGVQPSTPGLVQDQSIGTASSVQTSPALPTQAPSAINPLAGLQQAGVPIGQKEGQAPTTAPSFVAEVPVADNAPTKDQDEHLAFLKSTLSPLEYERQAAEYLESKTFEATPEEAITKTEVKDDVLGIKSRQKEQEQKLFERSFDVLEKDDPIVKAREEKEAQISSITDMLTEDFIGQSEEDVVKSLNEVIANVDKEYQLFSVSEKGMLNDAMTITNNYTGDNISISLDNFTGDRDKEEGKIAKGFIELNANFPEYSLITKEITDIMREVELEVYNKADVDPILKAERNKKLNELYKQKEIVKTKMRSYSSGHKYRDYAYNKMHETNTIDYDLDAAEVSQMNLEKDIAAYEEKVNFYNEGDFSSLSPEEQQAAIDELEVEKVAIESEMGKLDDDKYNIYIKQGELEEIAGSASSVAEDRGNIASGLTKSFTRGLATSMAMVAQTAGYEDVEAENIAKEIFYDGEVDAEYLSSEDRNMLEQALFGITESVGASLSFGPAGPAAKALSALGMYSMSYMGMKDEMDAPEFADVSDAEKTLLAGIYGATVGMLEKVGISKAVSKTPLGKNAISWVLAKTFKEIPKKASYEVFERAMKTNTKIAITKGLFDLAAAGAAEGGTEGLQEIADITIKEVFNEAKGKEMFATPQTWSEAWDQVSNSVKVGFVGGGAMNGFSQITRTSKDQWTKSSLKSIEKLINDPQAMETYNKFIKTKVLTGEMTKAEAEAEVAVLEETREELESIPDSVSEDDKHKAFSLMSERRAIQAEIEGKEKSLLGEQTERLSEINSELKEIGKKPREHKSALVYPKGVRDARMPSLDNVEVTVEEGADVEYKVDGEFYSEAEMSTKLEDKYFAGKVESGLIKVELTNPSQAIQEKLKPKEITDEKDSATNTGEVVTETKEEGQKAEETKPTDTKVEEVLDIAAIETEMSSLEDKIEEARSEGNKELATELQTEFNALEKQSEKLEWDSVMQSPLEDVSNTVDALIEKEKTMPDGYGSFIDKVEAKETKKVAEKYKEADKLTDKELEKDFKDAVFGNPTTSYSDGLKLRESANELAKRGATFESLINKVKQEFISDGFTEQEATDTVKGMLAPVFAGAKLEQAPVSTDIDGTVITKAEPKVEPKKAEKKPTKPAPVTTVEGETMQEAKTKPKDGKLTTQHERQFLRKKVTPETPVQAIMQYFLGSQGRKVKKSEVIRHTGYGAENRNTGIVKDADQLKSRRGFYRENGVSADVIAESLIGQHVDTGLFEGIDSIELSNMIMDVIADNNSIDHMASRFKEELTHKGVVYSKSSDVETIKSDEAQYKDAEEQTEFEIKQIKDKAVENYITDEELNKLSEEEIASEQASNIEYLESRTDEQITEEFGDIETEIDEIIEQGTREDVDKPKEKPSKPKSKEVEYEAFESAVSKGTKAAENWLDDIDKALTDFGKKTMGMNLPLAVAQAAVKAAKIVVKVGGSVSQAVDAAINSVKESDWYNSEATAEQKATAEQDVKDIFNIPIEKKETKAKKKPETKEKAPKEKDRSFAERQEEKTKKALSPEAKKYIPISNSITVAEANDFIETQGTEMAMKKVLDFDNKMEPRVRVTVGQILIKKFNDEGTDQGFENAVEVANELSIYATSLGQAVQAFSLWDKISAEGMIIGYMKNQDAARKALKKKKKNLYQGSKEGYKEGTKKASKKATDKVFGKNTPKVKKAKAFNMSKAELSKAKREALAKLKNSLKKGGGTMSSGGINVEAIEALGEYGMLVFADGVRTFKAWAAEMKEATGVTDTDALKSVWNTYKAKNGKTLEELANMASIEDVVADHFAESTDTAALTKKLQDTFDIDEELASGLAQELVAEFDKVVKRERKKEIKKKTITLSKEKKKAIEEISESEASSEEDIEAIIEESFGIKELTSEQIAEVKKLVDERDARPDGFLKDELTREILSLFEKANGISKMDIAWSMWYASVLSGYETQVLNVASNAMNLGLETLVTAIEKGPRQMAEGMAGMVSGLNKGSAEFNQVMSKGYSPEKIKSKIEVKDALENTDFMGGKLNPLTYFKYVGRFMSAVDTAAYMTAKAAREQEAAHETATEEGLRGSERKARVSEILNDSKEAYADAEIQATEEIEQIDLRATDKMSKKEKKRLIKLRKNEIIAESVDEEIKAQGQDFGSFVTFNYTPEGVIGQLASLASTAANTIPAARLIVPFTRIVANVLNQQLDYTPYGYLRATGWNFGTTMENSTSAKDKRDRNRKLIKATMGTILMVGVYSIIKSYEDDDEPLVEISGKGPSDYNKKNQMYAQGWRPYSIKVGDTWVSYQYSPIGLALAVMGNWMDNEKYKELDDEAASTQAVFAMLNLGSSVMDMSFLTGLSGLMSSLTSESDAEKKTDDLYRTVGKVGTSLFIPNLFKQLDKAYDPTIYDVNSLQASILKEIPIIKRYSDLKPKRNAFGQVVKKKGNRFFGEVTEDKVWLFMAKHKLFAPGTGTETKNIEGEKMTPDEFYEYTKKAGELAYEWLKSDMDSGLDSEFKEYTQEEKEDHIRYIFKEAKAEAKYFIAED